MSSIVEAKVLFFFSDNISFFRFSSFIFLMEENPERGSHLVVNFFWRCPLPNLYQHPDLCQSTDTVSNRDLDNAQSEHRSMPSLYIRQKFQQPLVIA